MAERTDIEEVPITKDPMTRIVPWIIALLVFLLCLVLVGASSIGTSVHRWQVGISHRITIEIPLQHELDRDRITTAVAQYLQVNPAVEHIEVADKTRLFSIFGVTPQQAMQYPDYILPILIEADLKPNQSDAVSGILTQLQQASPGVRIETYGQWHDMLQLLRQSLQIIGYIFVMLIAFTVIVMITLITKAGLAAHHESISILRLIGASNGYIATKFQNHAFKLSTRGAIMGFVLAIPVAWLLNLASVTLGVPEMLRPQIDPVLMLAMLIVPLFVVLLSICVSRFAVLRTLSVE